MDSTLLLLLNYCFFFLFLNYAGTLATPLNTSATTFSKFSKFSKFSETKVLSPKVDSLNQRSSQPAETPNNTTFADFEYKDSGDDDFDTTAFAEKLYATSESSGDGTTERATVDGSTKRNHSLEQLESLAKDFYHEALNWDDTSAKKSSVPADGLNHTKAAGNVSGTHQDSNVTASKGISSDKTSLRTGELNATLSEENSSVPNVTTIHDSVHIEENKTTQPSAKNVTSLTEEKTNRTSLVDRLSAISKELDARTVPVETKEPLEGSGANNLRTVLNNFSQFTNSIEEHNSTNATAELFTPKKQNVTEPTKSSDQLTKGANKDDDSTLESNFKEKNLTSKLVAKEKNSTATPISTGDELTSNLSSKEKGSSSTPNLSSKEKGSSSTRNLSSKEKGSSSTLISKETKAKVSSSTLTSKYTNLTDNTLSNDKSSTLTSKDKELTSKSSKAENASHNHSESKNPTEEFSEDSTSSSDFFPVVSNEQDENIVNEEFTLPTAEQSEAASEGVPALTEHKKHADKADKADKSDKSSLPRKQKNLTTLIDELSPSTRYKNSTILTYKLHLGGRKGKSNWSSSDRHHNLTALTDSFTLPRKEKNLTTLIDELFRPPVNRTSPTTFILPHEPKRRPSLTDKSTVPHKDKILVDQFYTRRRGKDQSKVIDELSTRTDIDKDPLQDKVILPSVANPAEGVLSEKFGVPHFREHLKEEKQKNSWNQLEQQLSDQKTKHRDIHVIHDIPKPGPIPPPGPLSSGNSLQDLFTESRFRFEENLFKSLKSLELADFFRTISSEDVFHFPKSVDQIPELLRRNRISNATNRKKVERLDKLAGRVLRSLAKRSLQGPLHFAIRVPRRHPASEHRLHKKSVIGSLGQRRPFRRLSRRPSRREILAERLLLPQPRKPARRPFFREIPANKRLTSLTRRIAKPPLFSKEGTAPKRLQTSLHRRVIHPAPLKELPVLHPALHKELAAHRLLPYHPLKLARVAPHRAVPRLLRSSARRILLRPFSHKAFPLGRLSAPQHRIPARIPLRKGILPSGLSSSQRKKSTPQHLTRKTAGTKPVLSKPKKAVSSLSHKGIIGRKISSLTDRLSQVTKELDDTTKEIADRISHGQVRVNGRNTQSTKKEETLRTDPTDEEPQEEDLGHFGDLQIQTGGHEITFQLPPREQESVASTQETPGHNDNSFGKKESVEKSPKPPFHKDYLEAPFFDKYHTSSSSPKPARHYRLLQGAKRKSEVGNLVQKSLEDLLQRKKVLLYIRKKLVQDLRRRQSIKAYLEKNSVQDLLRQKPDFFQTKSDQDLIRIKSFQETDHLHKLFAPGNPHPVSDSANLRGLFHRKAARGERKTLQKFLQKKPVKDFLEAKSIQDLINNKFLFDPDFPPSSFGDKKSTKEYHPSPETPAAQELFQRKSILDPSKLGEVPGNPQPTPPIAVNHLLQDLLQDNDKLVWTSVPAPPPVPAFAPSPVANRTSSHRLAAPTLRAFQFVP